MTEHVKARVPAIGEPLVQDFIARYRLTGTPVHLKYAEHGYDPDFCHLSAKHCAITNGGRRVHGWALWGFDGMLVGEHHSVWRNPDGDLVDVTPPKFSADHILFIQDDASDLIEVEGVFVMWADRTTLPNVLFAFQGNPIKEPTWGLHPNNKNIVEFCAKFDFSPLDMLTDERFG